MVSVSDDVSAGYRHRQRAWRQIRLDAAQSPRHLDFVHDDGLVWEAIYVAAPDFFRLNYVEAGGDTPRPTMFVTGSDAPGTVIVMER